MRDDVAARTIRPAWAQALMAALLGVLAFMLVTAHAAPAFHDGLAQEDGFVEWLTFCALLAVCVTLAYRGWGFRQNQPLVWRLVLALGALAFFFGAGEEISWGQRVFGFGEGLDLSANRQGETNLHNLQVGEFNLNKVLFTWGLGAALAVYFLLVTALAPRYAWLRDRLTAWGIPVASWRAVAWLGLCVAVALLIPHSRKWESLELVVPLSALVILYARGVVGRGLHDSVPAPGAVA